MKEPYWDRWWRQKVRLHTEPGLGMGSLHLYGPSELGDALRIMSLPQIWGSGFQNFTLFRWRRRDWPQTVYHVLMWCWRLISGLHLFFFYKEDKVQIQGPVHTRQAFHLEAKPQLQPKGPFTNNWIHAHCSHHCHSWNHKKLWTRGRGASPSPAAHHPSPSFTEETMRKRASESTKESWMWLSVVIQALRSGSRRITVSLWQIGLTT